MPDQRNYLITGAAGFIGSHFVERLLGEGATVTGFDNLSSGRTKWIEPVLDHPRFSFVRGDLRDAEALRSVVPGHEVVIHLGANTDIPGGNKDPRIDLENDIVATFNLLEAMRASDTHKILFASSATVYGDITILPTPETAGPLLPISVYGAGKLSCEGLISSYCHLFGLQGWIFRFGNVVGKRMGHGVIYDFIQKLRRNPDELEILGDGNQEKNFFLVEDCIDGMLRAFHHAKVESCDVFNLGTETTIFVRDIGSIVAKEMGLRNVTFRYTGGRRGWPGDAPIVAFNAGKMRALGWEAKHSSTEAVRVAARRLLGEGVDEGAVRA